jgi:hypothetical protein
MEKMKYVLLKTQSTEMGQFKEYSFHLFEVLKLQNKALCSVLPLRCPPVCGSRERSWNAEEKSQPNKNRMQHTSPSASFAERWKT